jgi:putative lipoic acid-binding regulatory protein|tara:strand:- start:212 stop:526 length:315 start_codon:yes stop_codon:yes gene_type:complete
VSDLTKTTNTANVTRATEDSAPLIEFPCDYPIKVLGSAVPELHQHVLQVMDTHAPGFDRSKIAIRDSSKGKWQAITVIIKATGKPQLEEIFADLKTSSRVKMVL